MKINDRFGAWEVKEVPKVGNILCLCTACGETSQSIRAYDLKNGKTLMCTSCSRKGTQKEDPRLNEAMSTWYAMKDRCLNENSKDWDNYGGRGITIHPLWIKSFEAFYLYIGPRPTPDCTIERVDYNKGYVPGNVKWLPRREQPKNKRDNIRITAWGETKLVSEWGQDPRCPVNEFCIYKRLKRGWEEERAVITPSMQEEK